MSYLLSLNSRLKASAPVLAVPSPSPSPAPAPEPVVQIASVPTVAEPGPFLSVSESVEPVTQSTSEGEAPAELAAVETVPIVEEESSSD